MARDNSEIFQDTLLDNNVLKKSGDFDLKAYEASMNKILDRREEVAKLEYNVASDVQDIIEQSVKRRLEAAKFEDAHNAKRLTLLKLEEQARENNDKDSARYYKRLREAEDVKYKTEKAGKDTGYTQRKEGNQALLDALKEQQEAGKDMMSHAFDGLNIRELGEGFKTFKEGAKLYAQSFTGGKTGWGAFENVLRSATHALANYTAQLNDNIKAIAGYKTAWDTRLYGASASHSSASDLVKNMVGVSPFIKQSVVMEKLNSAIDQGIAYNVEQRAFLDALSDSVATTFEAFDSTLKDIVRVQQQDSTAYRLGMEASLNEYLNKMFESTEYLSNVSDSVTSNLYEATSLLDAKTSIGFEYTIQKWLGSMYSVGMSQGAIQSISQALGQALSGNVSATDSGAGKLLVMAASNAGIDYADMLTQGIDESNLNTLMGAMVQYLQQIANDNKVVQTQYAKVFDLTTSDIQAAKNLKGYTEYIYKQDAGYGASDAASMLQHMGSSLNQRISLAGALENLTENFKYTLAEGIAANPALYSIFTIGNMMKDTGADINIPAIFGMGTGVNLGMTISDLMLSGSLIGSILTGLGGIVGGIGQIGRGGFNMNKFTNVDSVQIGKGFGGLTRKESESSITNMAGNTSASDLQDSATNQGESQKAEAGEQVDEDEQASMDDLVDSNEAIYDLLEQIVNKEVSIKVEQSYSGYEGMPGLGYRG